MRLSWKLGRVSGIDLFLHPSTLLAFLFATGFSSGGEAIAFVVALFASITLHELGHAWMARRYGIETADITLYLFGGVARMTRMPRSAGPEMLIALAGPAMNLAIVAVLLGVIGLASVLEIPTTFLAFVLIANLGLGLFNLLPAFPMDGGRVLRAVLSGRLGRLRATEVAASVGRFLAVFGGAAALAFGRWDVAILAAFVYVVGSIELRQVRLESPGAGMPEGLVNVPPPPAGFRWATRGDGVWRLVPIFAHVGGRDRSWN